MIAPLFKNVPGINTALASLGLITNPMVGKAYDQLNQLANNAPVVVNYQQRSMQGTVNNQYALQQINQTQQEVLQNEISKIED